MPRGRVREIGVRRVFGATLSSILTTLLGDITKLFVISSIPACVVAWRLANIYLSGYANRIQLGAILFVLPVIVVTLIGVATGFYFCWKAAITDPVHSLRYE